MAATSVTGVGSRHNMLDVSRLIGPKWTDEKEKKFESMGGMVGLLTVSSILSWLCILGLALYLHANK